MLLCVRADRHRYVVRRKEKICLVPVTRPYLFFSPDPLDFSLNIQENFKERLLKRSCKHSKYKTKLDNFVVLIEGK